MTATDDQAAALRAQLAGDHEEHRRLLAGLNSRGALAGYTAVVTAAFIEACPASAAGRVLRERLHGGRAAA